MECKCSVPGRITCNSVKGCTAQINPAAFIKAELFGTERNQSFSTKDFIAVTEGSWSWGWVFVSLLGNLKVFGFLSRSQICLQMWSWNLCDKVGQQKQLHCLISVVLAPLGTCLPGLQAVQREAQQQAEQNWICAAPGACLLLLSGPHLAAVWCPQQLPIYVLDPIFSLDADTVLLN